MLAIAILAVLGSAAVGYLIGAVSRAPRDAFFRTKRGITVLILVGVSVIPLPPQLLGLDGALGPLGGTLGDTASALEWPVGLSKGVYVGVWIVLTVAAFLVGIRIWQVGTAEWRGGANHALDSSAASKMSALLPLADRIEDALDTIGQAGPTPRDISRAADSIRQAGRHFADSLPPSDGEVYRLVSGRVTAAVAGQITGLLLEGAGRRAYAGG